MAGEEERRRWGRSKLCIPRAERKRITRRVGGVPVRWRAAPAWVAWRRPRLACVALVLVEPAERKTSPNLQASRLLAIVQFIQTFYICTPRYFR
jgi:hypothetical protein